MNITAIGFDLAKNVFQVHGVNERGHAVLKKQLKRSQVMAFFADLPPCLIGMEACGSAHHWARKLQELGHTTRLIAIQFVKPYVKSNKNDAGGLKCFLWGRRPFDLKGWLEGNGAAICKECALIKYYRAFQDANSGTGDAG